MAWALVACGGLGERPGQYPATEPVSPSTASVSPDAASPSAPAPTVVPTLPPGRTIEPLPEERPWIPGPGEIEPEAKIAAVRVVEALGAVDEPADLAIDATGERLRSIAADPRLAAAAGVLVPPEAPAVAQIVYPQYGGLTHDKASVMVVARQSWHDASAVLRSRTVTVDVRLAKAESGWVVTALRPVDSAPGARPDAGSPGPAAGLLDDPALDLPDAARAELRAGVVAEPLVRALTELAASHELSITVFAAGHPEEVFGTDRTSNHARGRAVDVWAVDDRPIVDLSLDDPRLLAFLDTVRATGADEIGGPVDLDGPGGVHFADDLHRDHVHIGFDPS